MPEPEGRPEAPAAGWRPAVPLAWALLALALAPVLAELAGHAWQEPWAGYAGLFMALFAAAALRERRPSRGRADGLLLLAGALALELVAVVGGPLRLGRPALPAAALGLARVLGRPSLPVALLALWWVPVPSALAKLASPALESAWLALAALPWELAGSGLVVEGPLATWAGARFQADHPDGGLPLLALFAGLGWYAALRAGGGLRSALLGALRWAPLALPAQLLAFEAALLGLAVGGPAAAEAALAPGAWIACGGLGLLRAERGSRRALGARSARPRRRAA